MAPQDRLAARLQVRHTPPVAREAQFPLARSRRRPHGRHAAVALVVAFAFLLIWPSTGPTGQVLDLSGNGGTGAA